MAIVDELIAVLGFEIRGEKDARRYEQSIDRLSNRLSAFSASAVRYGALIGTAMGAAFGALGKSVISTSAEFEGYQATLETIEGSAEKAKNSLDWISDFGKTTPYDVAGVTDAFVKLKAYGIDPIANDALRILGDTASAMNKPLNQAVEAFADAATGEFERLKEFGITSKSQGDKVTFAWTRNGKELTKTVKKNSEEIRKFLLENMGSRFNGAMLRQSKTWNGMMSNLGDTWTDFKRRIGEGGFFETVKGHLSDLLDTLDKLDKNGTLDRWSRNIGFALDGVVTGLGHVIERIGTHFSYLSENFKSFEVPLKAIGTALGYLLFRLFPMTSIMLLLSFAVDDFLTYLQGGQSIIGDFVAKLQELTGVSEETAEAMTGLGGAVLAAFAGMFLFNPFGFLKTALRGGFLVLFKDIPKLLSLLRGSLVAGIRLLQPAIAGAIGLLFTPAGLVVAIAGAGTALVWYFWDDLKTAWDTLSTKVSQLASDFGNWFEDASWGEIFVRTAFPLTNMFWDELVAGWQVLSSKVSELSNDFSSWISGIDWSKVFGPEGYNAVNGFWLDLKNAFGNLKDQITKLFTQMSDWILDIDWSGVGTSVIDGIGKGIKNSIGYLLEIIQNALRERGYDIVADLVFGNPDEKVKPAEDPGIKTTGKVVSEHKPTQLTDDAWDLKLKLQNEEALKAVRNFQANLAKTDTSEAAHAIANDNRQDNRDLSMTNTITIHQQVTEASQAPAALAKAAGSAVSSSMSKRRSQIETDPSF